MNPNEVWDKLLKPCFSRWSKEHECSFCSMRRACQQADPSVSDNLKARWRKEDGYQDLET